MTSILSTTATLDLTFHERLGEGGTGAVWRATNTVGNQYAVKFFNTLQVPREEVEAHIEALKKVKHRNVVSIESLINCKHPNRPDDNRLFPAIVMEFVAGEAFADWMIRTERAVVEVKGVLATLLDGLEAFHANQLTHGDLHSTNVFVSAGQAKIIDPLATDPRAVLSTALTAERRRRDISEATFLIKQSLLSLPMSVRARSEVQLFESSRMTIPDLREYISAVTNRIDEDSVAGEIAMPTNSFYRRCRSAQASTSLIEWQDAQDFANRHLRPELEAWIAKGKNAQLSDQDFGPHICGLVDSISLPSLMLAAARHGQSKYSEAYGLMRHVTGLNHGHSGITLGWEADLLAFHLFHFCGALCCAHGNLDDAIQLARTSVHLSRSGGWTQLWRRTDIVGWPPPSGDCNKAAEMIRKSFPYSTLLQETFVSEAEYHVGLTTMNLLLLCMDFVRNLNKLGKLQKHEDGTLKFERLTVPPHGLIDGTDALSTAAGILFGDGDVIGKVCASQICTTNQFREHWREWLEACVQMLHGLHYHFVDVPEFLDTGNF